MKLFQIADVLFRYRVIIGANLSKPSLNGENVYAIELYAIFLILAVEEFRFLTQISYTAQVIFVCIWIKSIE